MEPQVSADRRVAQPAPDQDRGGAQGARGHDHLAGAHGQPARAWPALGDRRCSAGIPIKGGLDAAHPAALDKHPVDPGVGHEPGAAQGRIGEVGLEAGALRAGPAAERARAARGAGRRVPLGRTGRDPDGSRAGHEGGVLGRQGRGGTDPELAPDRREVLVAGRAVEAGQAVFVGPLVPDRDRRVEAGHPVDRRAAADAGPGQDRDRAVPGRGQAVVEVEPVECGQLVRGHLGLGDERPGFEDDDRTAGLGQLSGDHAGPGARADHDDIGIEADLADRPGA